MRCESKFATYECFLLANHYRRLQVEVYNDQKFVVARLEEKVLDITEKDVYITDQCNGSVW